MLRRAPVSSTDSQPELGHDEEEALLSRERDISPSSTVGSHQEWDAGQWNKNIVLLLGLS
jgi:hypothetical protein